MHVPGGIASSLRAALTRGPGHLHEAIHAWNAWWLTVKELKPGSPRSVIELSLVLDLVAFIPAYAVVLMVVVHGLRKIAGEEDKERTGRLVGAGSDCKDAERRLRLHKGDPLLRSYETLLSYAGLGIFALVAVDLVEDLLAWLAFHSAVAPGAGSPPSGLLGWLLMVVSWSKWAIAAAVLLPVVISAYPILPVPIKAVTKLVKVLRAQVVLVAVFAAALFLETQVPDVILRWDFGHGLVAVVSAAVLAVVVWASGRGLVQRAVEKRPGRVLPSSPVILAGVALGAVALPLVFALHLGRGLLIPPAMVILIGLLSWPLNSLWKEPSRGADVSGSPDAGSPRSKIVGRSALPAALGASVIALTGLGLLRTAVGPAVLDRWRSGVGQVILGVLLVFGAIAAYQAFTLLGRRMYPGETPSPSLAPYRHAQAAGMAVSTVALAFIWWRVIANPYATGVWLGGVGVLIWFLVLALSVGSLLVRLSEFVARKYEPPAAFRTLGLKTIPVFTLVLIWAFVGVRVDDGSFHEVRVVNEKPGAANGRDTLDGAFAAWTTYNAADIAAPPTPAGARRAVPLMLVTAEGGGIRAADFTARALDCIFDAGAASKRAAASVCSSAAAPASHGSPLPSDARWIFASSSVSGGSLGFMEYAAHLSGSSPPGEGPGWIGRVLGGDYVAPSVAWQLFVELPRSFVLFDHAQDRAAVLDRRGSGRGARRPDCGRGSFPFGTARSKTPGSRSPCWTGRAPSTGAGSTSPA